MSKLDDINKVLRENGKPELTELPSEKKPNPEGKTPEQIEAEKVAAELARKNEEEKNTPQEKEIDDIAVLAYLNKQGINATSLEDLKKPVVEDKEKIAERKEAEKLSWGLSNGKFTRKEYETLVTDSTNLEKLAFSDYYTKAKAEDPNLSDEEIQTEFAEIYGINEDVNSRKYKNGQRNLNVVANEILKSKHQKILALDNEFSSFEQQQLTAKEKERKIIAQAPIYKKDVQTAMNKIKKITAKFDDTESYEAQVADELITKVENEFLSPAYAAKMIEKGYTVDQIEEIGITRVLREAFPILTKEVAIQYHNKKVAGTKGVLPLAPVKLKDGQLALTEDQKKMVEEYQKNKREVETPIAN